MQGRSALSTHAWPLAAALASLLSVQFGAAVAKQLFAQVGPQGVVALRLGLGALMLALLVGATRWRGMRPVRAPDLLAYGVVLGLMNLMIYQAIERIPLGIAVSIEVLGPLAVAAWGARRRRDLLWVALSLLGLALLPLGQSGQAVSIAGLAFALAAAGCWALYLLLGARVAEGGTASVAVGMAVAAAFAVPLGAAHAGWALVQPQVLWVGLGVALLSNAVPYALDMVALRHLPTAVLGVLMSASPAVSALAGWWVLGETLTHLQMAGAACITAACAGVIGAAGKGSGTV